MAAPIRPGWGALHLLECSTELVNGDGGERLGPNAADECSLLPGPLAKRWPAGWLAGRGSNSGHVKPGVPGSQEGNLTLNPVRAGPVPAALGFALKWGLLAHGCNRLALREAAGSKETDNVAARTSCQSNPGTRSHSWRARRRQMHQSCVPPRHRASSLLPSRGEASRCIARGGGCEPASCIRSVRQPCSTLPESLEWKMAHGHLLPSDFRLPCHYYTTLNAVWVKMGMVHSRRRPGFT